MRVSPRELKAVRAGGLVTRYAVLGDAVFVVADLPDGGTAGTSVEEPCRLEHWGLVLQGELTLTRAPGPHVRRRARRSTSRRDPSTASTPTRGPWSPASRRSPSRSTSRPRRFRPAGVEILPGLGAAAAAPDEHAHRRAPEPDGRGRRDRDRVGGDGRVAVHAVDLRPAERLRRVVVRPRPLGLRPRREPGPPLGGRRARAAGSRRRLPLPRRPPRPPDRGRGRRDDRGLHAGEPARRPDACGAPCARCAPTRVAPSGTRRPPEPPIARELPIEDGAAVS